MKAIPLTTSKFLDTGIKELNNLLTRDDNKGIAIPGNKEYAASSTLVIKGTAGTGKSVLSSILAYNMHLKVNEQGILPFCIYFSFAQPARSVFNYVREILSPEVTPSTSYPLFVSPRRLRGLAETGGHAMLRRCLLDNLCAIDTIELDDIDIGSNIGTHLTQCISHFQQSADWESWPPESESIINPASLSDIKLRLLPIILVDPINFFFDYRDSRFAVAELFETFRTLKYPLIVTLEESGEAASEDHRQLMSHVEFEADAVIHLKQFSEDHYVRNSIEITKSRNSQQRYGPQVYRIEKPDHSLREIPSSWRGQGKHPGFLIFKSIHWQLSDARRRLNLDHHYRSGISAFDDILQYNMSNQKQAKSLLPADASILIQGRKGGHKLSLAFNILVAGLWNPRKDGDSVKSTDKKTKPQQSVLLLSFGEETRMHIDSIALAERLSGSPVRTKKHDNAAVIKRIAQSEETQNQVFEQKVIIHEWNWYSQHNGKEKEENTKLIEVTFEPGRLGVEEFLWCLTQLCDHYNPSRILIDNTAYLETRFPDLYKENMLFSAISSYTQSKQIMLIVNDVLQSNVLSSRSFGLSASADYLLRFDAVDSDDLTSVNQLFIEKAESGSIGSIMKLDVTNIRGKNYRKGSYFITTSATVNGNRLYFMDRELLDVKRTHKNE